MLLPDVPCANAIAAAVHRVAALLKRWLLGTHQGSVAPEHLQAYLDEFTFRFNRRTSRSRGLLFYRLLEGAVAAKPLTYANLVSSRKPKRDGLKPHAALKPTPGPAAPSDSLPTLAPSDLDYRI